MTDPLSPEEIDRYRRHIVLAEIGGAGQQKLKAANVLIVGAGGLGAPVIQYLAAAGIGHIGVLDDDTVSLSNLQRQVIHDTAGLGTAKIDGSDNFDTRYASADAAEAARIPLVTGAVGRFDGSLTVLKPYEAGPDGTLNPGYRDLFPSAPPPGVVPACAEAGIVGALTGVIGTLMAMEAIKLVTGAGEPLVGRLLLYDGLAARFETLKYRRRKG